jgi:predicted metalloprotease with PDZ domain
MIIALIAAAAISAEAAAASCAGAASHYVVSRADENSFKVDARFDTPVARLDLYAFAVPGRPEGQAESIRDLVARDAAGSPIAVRYAGEGGWEFEKDKPAASISYRVVADHDAVDWSAGGPGKDEVAARFGENFFFAGHAFFLVDFDAAPCPAEVEFKLPKGWHVTSPWPIHGAVATARDPGNLARNVFVMGETAPRRAVRSGVDIQWLMSEDTRSIGAKVDAMMPALFTAYAEYFGGVAVDRFTAVMFGDTMTDGGAFEDSFAMRIASPLSAADEPVWAHTLGHEVLHLWNGAGGITGSDPARTYWFTEGFTDYLTIKQMWRAGLIDEETLKRRLAGVLRRYEVGKAMVPGVKLVEAGANKFQNWALVYGGGAVIAMLMDAELSQDDPDALRNAMRDLFARRGESFDHETLMARLNASTGGKAQDVFDFVDGAPSSAAVRARLKKVGVDAAYFGFDEAYVAFSPCGRKSCLPAFLVKN